MEKGRSARSVTTTCRHTVLQHRYEEITGVAPRHQLRCGMPWLRPGHRSLSRHSHRAFHSPRRVHRSRLRRTLSTSTQPRYRLHCRTMWLRRRDTT